MGDSVRAARSAAWRKVDELHTSQNAIFVSVASNDSDAPSELIRQKAAPAKNFFFISISLLTNWTNCPLENPLVFGTLITRFWRTIRAEAAIARNASCPIKTVDQSLYGQDRADSLSSR